MMPININQVAIFAALALHGVILLPRLTPEPPRPNMFQRINVRLVSAVEQAPLPAAMPLPRPPEPVFAKEPPRPAPSRPSPRQTPPAQLGPPEPLVATSVVASASISAAATAAEGEARTSQPAVWEAPAAQVSSPQDLEPSYLETISAWLERRKSYPMAARRRGLEGEVVVRLQLDNRGNVVSCGLARSSGHALLDDAVLRLVHGSQPFPTSQGGEQIPVFLVPVRFNLKT